MKRVLVGLLAISAAILLAAACTPAAPAPTSAPAKAAAQPTAVPAAKVEYPAKGRSVTMIIPYAAGGSTDVGGRLLAPLMEKSLGTTVEIVNREGAASQVGTTEMAKSKPDGYTIALAVVPPAITAYLDPRRGAAFGRKDLLPIAMHVYDPIAVSVAASSPHKSLKDLVDAAKANPNSIKVSDSGLGGTPHLSTLALGKAAGVQFASVHFTGDAPAGTALLGGHVDAWVTSPGQFIPHIKSGALRAIGVFDSQESPYLPGAKTAEAQGYKLSFAASRGIVGPAGIPKEIVQKLSASVKAAIDDPDHKKRAEDAGLPLRYMDPDAYAAYWDDMEQNQMKDLIRLLQSAQ